MTRRYITVRSLPLVGVGLIVCLALATCAKEDETTSGGSGMVSAAQAQGLARPENVTEAEYKTDPPPPPFLADEALSAIPSTPGPTGLPARLGFADGAEGKLGETTCLGHDVTVALWKHPTPEAARAACRSAATEVGAEEGDVRWAIGSADGRAAGVAACIDEAGDPWVVSVVGDDFDAVMEAVARARAQLGLTYPATVGEWSLEEPATAYDRITVYEPINGGAEQYFRYNFTRLYRGRYVREGAGIVADVYEHSTSADAWGVQSAYLTQRPAEVGQDGYAAPLQITFWQGPYFCRLTSERRTDGADDALLDVGRALSDALVVQGVPPDMLSLLYAVELERKSAHYCHEMTDLTKHYYISTDNVLDLGKDTDCVVGKFAGVVGEITVVIVRYPDSERPLSALQSLASLVRLDAAPDNVYTAEWDPGKCMSVMAEREWLVAVFDAPMPMEAETMAASIIERVP